MLAQAQRYSMKLPISYELYTILSSKNLFYSMILTVYLSSFLVLIVLQFLIVI